MIYSWVIHLLSLFPSHTFKILSNVTSTENVKKRQYKSVKTLSGLQIPKIKRSCLNNASSFENSFTSNHTTLTCLFDVFKIKSLCNANLTIDVTPFCALFLLIFQVGSRSFQYYLAVSKKSSNL